MNQEACGSNATTCLRTDSHVPTETKKIPQLICQNWHTSSPICVAYNTAVLNALCCELYTSCFSPHIICSIKGVLQFTKVIILFNRKPSGKRTLGKVSLEGRRILRKHVMS